MFARRLSAALAPRAPALRAALATRAPARPCALHVRVSTCVTRPTQLGRRPLGMRLCSTEAASGPAVRPSQPPFPVRVALVGTTVGLATPLLAVGGVVFA
eukprot:1716271-Prymnesium_polylepis.1